MTMLEIAASTTITLSIFLAGRNSVHTWWTGIIGCALFAILFYQVKLYADVLLQIFFLIASGVGWWQWLYGEHGNEKPISRAGLKNIALLMPLGWVIASMYGALLHFFTDAYAPFLDSGILVFSVIGQWLLMHRRLECWFFWLLVNSIACPLYASRELYLTVFLYAAYWVNAIYAFWYWRKQLRQNTDVSASLADAV